MCDLETFPLISTLIQAISTKHCATIITSRMTVTVKNYHKSILQKDSNIPTSNRERDPLSIILAGQRWSSVRPIFTILSGFITSSLLKNILTLMAISSATSPSHFSLHVPELKIYRLVWFPNLILPILSSLLSPFQP